MTTNLFCQRIAVVIVANVPSRSPNQLGNGRPIRVFGHVESNNVVFVAEHIQSQLLSQFSLPDSGWSNEQEAADWTITFVKAGPVPPNCAGNGINGFILADDLALEAPSQAFEPFDIAGAHLGNRNASQPFN